MSAELRSWIIEDLSSARMRLNNGVLNIIPPERATETVDGGGIAPVYVTWHMTRHHDVAINSVLRGRDQVVHDHTDALGVSERLYRGLSEGADLDLVAVLDPEAVNTYALATLDATIGWLESEANLDGLDTVPNAAAALEAMGTPTDDFDWLYGMWSDKPKQWFLSWEGIDHVVTHTGELVSIRNRMGLSPF